MIKYNRSLSKQEYDIVYEFIDKKLEIINLDEASKILKIKKKKLWDIFHRLERKGWLERIERGKYLIVPFEAKEGWLEHPFVLASKLINNYYVSYRTALSYYGLTEQIPVYIYIATINRKGKLEKDLQMYKFRFIKINKKKFFGYKKEIIDNKEVCIAEKEKAIIDCLDKEKYSGTITEIIKALNSNLINLNKLKKYAIKMKNASLIRRLGYLLDVLNKDSSGLIRHIGKHRLIYLSTIFLKNKIEINNKWKLIININKDYLLKW